MYNNRLSCNLNKLRSDIQINNLTLDAFLNDKIFYQEGSRAGIYICTYKKDPHYVYIGKTNDFMRRWKEHERDLSLSIHCGKFQDFYLNNHCTLDDFKWGILDVLENNPKKLAIQEKKRIHEYDNDGYHILLNTIKYRR